MLKNVKIGPKLIGGFVLIATFSLIVGVVGLINLGSMRDHFNEVGRDFLPSIAAVKTLDAAQTAIDGAENAMVAVGVAADQRAAAVKRVEEHKVEFDSAFVAYAAMPKEAEEEAVYRDFTAKKTEWWQHHEEFMRRVRAAESSNNKFAIDSVAAYKRAVVTPAFSAANDALDKLTDFNEKYAAAALLGGDAQYRNSRWIVISSIVICMIVAIGIGLFISRSLVIPLDAVAKRAERLQTHCVTSLEAGLAAMARGDLSVQIVPSTTHLEFDRADEIGMMAMTVDNTISKTQAAVASYAQLQQIVKALVVETDALSRAASDGALSTRGNAAQFQGAYHDLVQGFNTTLDRVLDPINDAAQVLERVAERDLTARVTADYKGDHAKIKLALNTAVGNLQQALDEISGAAEQVAAAADQIATSSQSLAQGASEQASTIEEVSSSLHEITSMAKTSAASAKEAETLAEAAKNGTDMGTEKMHELAEAMGKLKNSSDQTAKIVKTIDEIAFQTNLLALNAAVEAARAGDAGKGFAVVADEVRALSIRAAEAAKQTSALIEESVGHTQQGVVMTKAVQETFTDIAKRANRVREVMAEMAAASEQQTLGIGQVNTAVEQMNATTQQTAATAEESAAAAEELTSQATQVRGLVGEFALGGGHRSTGPALHAPRHATRTPPSVMRGTPARAVSARAASVIPFGNDEDDLSGF